MGKITVKHYLNTRLKPEMDNDENNNEIETYPVYVSITVNKVNIRKSSAIFFYISENDFNNKLDNYKYWEYIIKYEIDTYTHIVEILLNDIKNDTVDYQLVYSSFNRNKSKDKFTNLLNLYIDFYTSSIYDAVSGKCYNEIINGLYKKIKDVFITNETTRIENMFSIRFSSIFNYGKFIKDNVNEEIYEYFILFQIIHSSLGMYANKTGYDVPYIDWIENKIQPLLIENIKDEKYIYLNRYNYDMTDEKIHYFINTIDNIVRNDYLYCSSELKNKMDKDLFYSEG